MLSGVPVDLGRDGQEPDGDEDKGKADKIDTADNNAKIFFIFLLLLSMVKRIGVYKKERTLPLVLILIIM